MRVLIVEDEPDISLLVTSRLSKVGFEVLSACDGEDGLRQAREQKPDLIVLDLMLPKLRGEEVCKAVRADSDRQVAKIPIIMFTAKDTKVDQVVGKVIGATSYVTKPFSGDDLVKEVNRALGVTDK